MKYLRFYPSLVKQCYCTTQRPPFVSILSCSHVLGTTTIHGALLSCGIVFASHIFCVAHFFASHILLRCTFFTLHIFGVAQFLRSTFFASTFGYFWDSVTSSRRFFSRKMLELLQIFCYFWDLQNQVFWHLSLSRIVLFIDQPTYIRLLRQLLII